MKKTIHNIAMGAGMALFMAGILGYGSNELGFININQEKLPLLIIVLGLALAISGGLEKYIASHKVVQIEAKDERNIMLANSAKAFAYDLLTILLALTIVVLTLFELIPLRIFVILFAVYMVGQVAFVFKLRSLHGKM